MRKRAGAKCERCKVLPMSACHHLTYARKYDELIRQSEIALDKMKMNTMKLSEALNSALEDGI